MFTLRLWSHLTSRPRRAGALAVAMAFAALAPGAHAFCGFYVAKADVSLYNQASQVALVRDGDRTVLTMSNDYEGSLAEFALVVPVPVVLQKEQIHIGDKKLLDRLDAFTAPRLVEYHDPDPCMVAERRPVPSSVAMSKMSADSGAARQERAQALGVTIEAQYTVGEYDILILSAKQSNGLETWLTENGYRLPAGASKALAPYIRQELKFFVAKVNLEEQKKTGFRSLRPLQMAYESPRFMLPIRLGMLNAKGAQDLMIYALTRNGRVETTNYRTVKIPTDSEIPPFVKAEFADFYRDMFKTAWTRENQAAVFLEYFWDMGWCDPCAADPLTRDELQALGVFWLDGDGARREGRMAPQQAQNAVVTRLHVRYDAQHFPEDLMFQETQDRQNFQGRYVMHHPFTGSTACEAGREYRRSLRERRNKEAQTLASLTGWPMERIRGKMGGDPIEAPDAEPAWWKGIWK